MTGVPRETHHPLIHFLRADLDFNDANAVRTIGTIPAGSVIILDASGINISTVYNAGTTNTAQIGLAGGAGTEIASALAAGSLGFKTANGTGSLYVATDTDITAEMLTTGTAATTGVSQVIVAYVPNNGNNAVNV